MRVAGQRRDDSIPTLFLLSGTALSTSAKHGPYVSPVLRGWFIVVTGHLLTSEGLLNDTLLN